MAGEGKGVALAAVGAGVLLLYAGIKGKSIPSVVQSLIKGSPPSTAASANQITGTTSSSPGSPGTIGTTGDTGGSQSALKNQALARLSVVASHPSWAAGQEWTDWVSLWNQESGWNNLAQNSGSGALGIAQALGHGVDGSAGKYGNEYGGYGLSVAAAKNANDGDALPQIQWGIQYIAETYGSPSAAWAHEQANNWY